MEKMSIRKHDIASYFFQVLAVGFKGRCDGIEPAFFFVDDFVSGFGGNAFFGLFDDSFFRGHGTEKRIIREILRFSLRHATVCGGKICLGDR